MPSLARSAGRARPQRDARRENGQVLILFVMGATVIFVIGAIVVDIGLWVSERRNAQAAADLASLAAATQLAPNNTNAIADAQAKGLDYAKRNGYDPADSDITVTVTTPFQSDSEKVQVIVDERGGSLFAGIFGITSMDVGATAVAAYGESQPGPDVALFASRSDDECDEGPTLDIEAQHVDVTGSTHTNEIIYIDGPDDNFSGPITYVCLNGFTQGSQQNGTYQPFPRMINLQASPLSTLTLADIPCDFTFDRDVVIDSESALWASGNQLRSNVICATGDLRLTRPNTQGHVTFVALGDVTISGADNNLQPADKLAGSQLNNLLVYSSSAVNIVAPGGAYQGYIHAPNGLVSIDGSHTGSPTTCDSGVFCLEGSVVADRIHITGSWFEFHGAGLPGPPGPPNIHLED